MIGREEESKYLLDALSTGRSEMIAVIGRRRVGKTYLVKEVYKEHLLFQLTGTQYATIEEQLYNFTQKMNEYDREVLYTVPGNWTEAFLQLKRYLIRKKSKQRKVIFFDELPWLASRRSGFLEAFTYFWNDWASEADMVIVVCGSAASWMIDNVINHKGGLHNRITKRIHLEPFTLKETALFLKKNKVFLDYYQIIQLYMIMGGIPYYLNEINSGETAAQNINRICFGKSGLLRTEFQNLYAALFEFHENHVSIVEALSTKWKGMTRNEIIQASGFTNGGGLTKILYELTSSSFITAYQPFGKKKRDTLYRLTDEYSLFYLKFIKDAHTSKTDVWLQYMQTPKYQAWSGYAFECLCLKHITSIKKALGIPALYTEESSFISKGNETTQGIQIDMLIDRKDNAINICEMKFLSNEMTVSKEYATVLRRRREAFREITRTKKHLFTTLITTYGLIHNEYSLGTIDQVVTVDEFFL